jgi:hypothetical protein
MSHQERIDKLNAELNTADSWARRWQIEREANERFGRQASLVRSGVQSLRAAAVQRFTYHQHAAAADSPGGKDSAEVHHRLAHVHTGRVRALDDVLDLLDEVDRAE